MMANSLSNKRRELNKLNYHKKEKKTYLSNMFQLILVNIDARNRFSGLPSFKTRRTDQCIHFNCLSKVRSVCISACFKVLDNFFYKMFHVLTSDSSGWRSEATGQAPPDENRISAQGSTTTH